MLTPTNIKKHRFINLSTLCVGPNKKNTVTGTVYPIKTANALFCLCQFGKLTNFDVEIVVTFDVFLTSSIPSA